ncbi:hypothetical protein LTR37_014220 [Vermiconidia calcicola]|uniref:Uncharacterized protein n=1 Tax=Vermiconidia calcicola TaxID=1690605 RepID=A0ACC3MU07_9PEZI|nr:hypothetical protein LTR37_014220 [Vermiconidia calcicola]
MERIRILLLIARLIQNLGGVIMFAVTVIMSSHYVPVFGAMNALIGGIGLFSFKRPNDVHWHLMLSLDWLALLANITQCVICALTANYEYCYYSWGGAMMFCVITWVATIMSGMTLVANLIILLHTHRLKAKGVLQGQHSDGQKWREDPKYTDSPGVKTSFIIEDGQISEAETSTRAYWRSVFPIIPLLRQFTHGLQPLK